MKCLLKNMAYWSFVVVQLLSCVQLIETPWTAAHQASLSITNSQILFKLISVELVITSNHLIPCHPLFLLPSIFLASGSFPMNQFFASGGKILELQLQYQSFQWIFRLISFRIHWFDLLAVQGTLKSLLQQYNSKPSILQCSAFFMVQLLHPYMTTGKAIALTMWIFVNKVVSLPLNMLPRFVIIFLPGSKCLNFVVTVMVCSDFGAFPVLRPLLCFPVCCHWVHHFHSTIF